LSNIELAVLLLQLDAVKTNKQSIAFSFVAMFLWLILWVKFLFLKQLTAKQASLYVFEQDQLKRANELGF
jgi:hypothetical protein